jgi:hypothetical protein
MSDAISSSHRVRPIIGVSLLLVLGLTAYFLFTVLSGRQESHNMESAYLSLALNAVLVAGALAAGRMPALLFSHCRQEQLGPAAVAGSYVLAGVGVWRGLASLSGQGWILPRIGLVCLTGAIGMSLSHLAVYAERSKFAGAFGGFLRWLAKTRSHVAVIAVGIGAYAFLIHPSFSGDWEYAALTEWIFVTVAGAIILTVACVRIRHNLIRESEVVTPAWIRHRQQTIAKADANYLNVRNLERGFVRDSNRTLLFHFLTTRLTQNEVREDHVAAILSSLIEYQGHSKDQKGRSERERLLVDLVGGLQRILQPARSSSYAVRQGYGKDEVVAAEEPKRLSGFVNEFQKTGDRSRLAVRLSVLLAQSGTRAEDIEEVLRPLVSAQAGYNRNASGRERLWREIISRAADYAPALSLKE